MKTKVTSVRNSEYDGYFTIELEVNNETFESLAVFTKANIKTIFNLTEEEFNSLKK